jgi:hypothetical protein
MLLKKIFWFWWSKKKKLSDSEFLSYNLMINSGKKFRALRDKKNKYSNFCVLGKKKFWTKQKTIPPHLQVKWVVPKQVSRRLDIFFQLSSGLITRYISVHLSVIGITLKTKIMASANFTD